MGWEPHLQPTQQGINPAWGSGSPQGLVLTHWQGGESQGGRKGVCTCGGGARGRGWLGLAACGGLSVPGPGCVCAHACVCARVCHSPAPPPHASLRLPGELFLQNMKMTVRVTHAWSPHTAPLPRGPPNQIILCLHPLPWASLHRTPSAGCCPWHPLLPCPRSPPRVLGLPHFFGHASASAFGRSQECANEGVGGVSVCAFACAQRAVCKCVTACEGGGESACMAAGACAPESWGMDAGISGKGAFTQLLFKQREGVVASQQLDRFAWCVGKAFISC